MINGKVLIFSAPSGSGKTTIVKHLLDIRNDLGFSISATTRTPRANEKDGIDYYFLSVEEFKDKIKRKKFVEWEEVYPGSYYGTLKQEIDRLWSEGKHVVFDVDVYGGINLKDYFKDTARSIFIKVPSMEVLTQRLLSRKSESPQSVKKRLQKALEENKLATRFDEVIVNDQLENALTRAEEIVNRFIYHQEHS